MSLLCSNILIIFCSKFVISSSILIIFHSKFVICNSILIIISSEFVIFVIFLRAVVFRLLSVVCLLSYTVII